MKHLVFIGPPGAGKGTQASFLINQHKYSHVSTGDLLRKEIASKSDIGLKVEGIMASGELVSDELIIKILKNNLNFKNNKYIFDGFPRNLTQASFFHENLMSAYDYIAVHFKVDLSVLFNRLINRRVSADGKHIYNLLTSPPRVPGVCDISGLPIVQRDDDMPEVVSHRLKVYDELTKPMIEYFEKLGKLAVVNADQEIEKVKNELISLIS
jgi:adenylate kinase